ncbi:MAG: ATP-dependent Clp protease proteolytic subunit [Eubacterium sp.]
MINYVENTNKGRQTFLTNDLLTLNRVIMIKDIIDNRLALNIVELICLMETQNDKDITVCINSPGGSINAGLLITDAFEGSKCDIRTVCLGECYSMGAFILAAGTKGKRCINKHGSVMIHEPLIQNGAGGNCTTIEQLSKSMLSTKKLVNSMLADYCNKTINEINEATNNQDNFMNAYEACKFGIVDYIADDNLISVISGKDM